MDFIITIFNETLYRPLFSLLVWVYNVIPGQDLGVAIIVVTVFLRVVLYPLSHKALKSQRALQELQPKIKEIQQKVKNKQEKAKVLMEFYKKNKVNPFSGCLPLLIQLPILIGLYRVFLTGLNPESLEVLYPFIQNPGELNHMFLGMINLAQPNHIFAVLAGLSQFLQSKATYQQKSNPEKSNPGASSTPDFSKIMSQQMIYMMPLVMIFITWSLPAGLALYWIVTMIFSLGQQLVVNKSWKVL